MEDAAPRGHPLDVPRTEFTPVPQTVGMVDLSVAVTPLYFGSMAWEKHALEERAKTLGPSAADYERPDTRTSLAMGVLSLTTPITAGLAAYAVPFKVVHVVLAVVSIAAAAWAWMWASDATSPTTATTYSERTWSAAAWAVSAPEPIRTTTRSASGAPA